MRSTTHDYAQALDALAFTCLHGDRTQQLIAANSARDMLLAGGYPVRRLRRRWFDVSVRNADGLHCWTAHADSSIDALLGALARFDGQQIAVTIKARRPK